MHTDLYAAVWNWSRSSRHALFCYQLLRIMASHANIAFYDTGKPSELLLKIAQGLRVRHSEDDIQ